MKKKFFAMYALVGALVASPVFTSCIDDTESESVTAVRNQKAEQIRIANQIAAAKAELQMQYDKLKLEADIAQQKSNLAKYEGELLSYQLTLKQNQEALDNFGKVELSVLASNYTSALSSLSTAEWNVIKYNQQIKDLKEGYVTAEETLASQIEGKNTKIAKAQAKIDQLKEWIENGAIDRIELESQITELQEAQRKLYNDKLLLDEQYGSLKLYKDVFLYNDWNDLNSDGVQDPNELTPVFDYAETKLATIEAARKLKDLNPAVIKTNAEDYLVLGEVQISTMKDNVATIYENAEKTLAAAVAALGTEADKKDATYYDATLAIPANVQTLYAKLAEAKETFAAAEKVYNEKNDAVEKAKKAVADAQTALDTENAKETPDAAKVTELTTALTTAQTALTTAQTALTADIVTDYNTAKSDLATAEGNILTAKDNIVGYENNVASAKEDAENFDAWVAAFSGDDYTAYKEAKDAIEEAQEAYSLALAEENALRELKNALNTKESDVTVDGEELTFAEAVEKYEADIEEYKEEIAELKIAYQYSNIDVESEEALAIIVAYLEKELENEEFMVTVYKKEVEEAKAALDAYLAE